MKRVMNIVKPKSDPKQKLRDWQRKLRQECRNIERQIRGLQIFDLIALIRFFRKVSNFEEFG